MPIQKPYPFSHQHGFIFVTLRTPQQKTSGASILIFLTAICGWVCHSVHWCTQASGHTLVAASWSLGISNHAETSPTFFVPLSRSSRYAPNNFSLFLMLRRSMSHWDFPCSNVLECSWLDSHAGFEGGVTSGFEGRGRGCTTCARVDPGSPMGYFRGRSRIRGGHTPTCARGRSKIFPIGGISGVNPGFDELGRTI